MKKVFFTAIAMIAFSSASMANTIADEEVVIEEKKEVVVKKDCRQEAMISLEQYEATYGCLDGTQATYQYQLYFNKCQNN